MRNNEFFLCATFISTNLFNGLFCKENEISFFFFRSLGENKTTIYILNKYSHTHTHTHIYIHTHTHICTHIYKQINIYIYIYEYIYPASQQRAGWDTKSNSKQSTGGLNLEFSIF